MAVTFFLLMAYLSFGLCLCVWACAHEFSCPQRLPPLPMGLPVPFNTFRDKWQQQFVSRHLKMTHTHAHNLETGSRQFASVLSRAKGGRGKGLEVSFSKSPKGRGHWYWCWLSIIQSTCSQVSDLELLQLLLETLWYSGCVPPPSSPFGDFLTTPRGN